MYTLWCVTQRGSRADRLSILMFAICQGILLYCAGWTIYQTVPHTAAGWQDVSALFDNRTFLDMALSLMVSEVSGVS